MQISNVQNVAGGLGELTTYVQTAARAAFAELQAMFAQLIFDLRRTNFQEIQASFNFAKQQIEGLLNADIGVDLQKLAREFNRLAYIPIRSSDNNRFEVMARLGRQGRIELMFLEA